MIKPSRFHFSRTLGGIQLGLFYIAFVAARAGASTYQPDNATAFANPERGYREPIDIIIDPKVNPRPRPMNLRPGTPGSANAGAGYSGPGGHQGFGRTQDYSFIQKLHPGATVLQSYIHLDLWQDGSPLPKALLDNLASGLAGVRAAGLKIILRPAYTMRAKNTTPVTESTILHHIAQLYPVISANSDVVMSLQAGWLGQWGEWHTSNVSYTDWDSRIEADSRYRIVKAILAATPANIPVEVRQPVFLREFFNLPVPSGSSALTQEDRDRVGYHDDSFLYDYYDCGSYAAKSPLWMGGFTPSQEARWEMSRLTSKGGNQEVDGEPYGVRSLSGVPPQYMNDAAGINAQRDMNSFHWTVFADRGGRSFEEHIWEATPLAASGNDPAETLYTRLQRKMGYRLRLISAHYAKTAVSGEAYPVAMSLNNDGYAGPIKGRPIYLVFDGAGNRYNVPMPDVDVRTWVSGPVGLTQTIPLPAMTPGTYKLALWLPDSAANLQSNPAYSIRLANEGIWDPKNGYNVIDSAVAVGGAPGHATRPNYGRSLDFMIVAGKARAAKNVGQFCNPSGIAVDSDGNVYVADAGNDTIRKVAPNGVVTTIAGRASVEGSADGAGALASFREPSGIAVGANGVLYVADSGNHTIRKISAGGVVTTLAGQAGLPGSSDGLGAAAQFHFPAAVAADGAGNVYVADEDNNTIRKVAPSGIVTTVAGSPGLQGNVCGSGSVARFFEPVGIAVDAAGNLYVADAGNNTIRKITAGGTVSNFAGDPTMNAYYGLYTAPPDPNTIPKSAMAGAQFVATGADGQGSAAQFFFPSGVTVDSSGNVYVADAYADTVRKITPAGRVATLAGTLLKVGTSDGAGSAARFNQPCAIAIDPRGLVYVADAGNSTVRKITAEGNVTTLAGTAGRVGSADGSGGTTQFFEPGGVAVAADGTVYVADLADDTIRKVDRSGTVSTLAGDSGVMGSADGARAQFFSPSGIALDGNGNIYVADAGNDTIRRLTPSGVVTTLAGTAGQKGAADGRGNAARFDEPSSLAVDAGGDIYVADTANDTIRKITPDGVVTTLAGSAGQSGSVDGAGAAARFDRPSGMVVDTAGVIYVADADNQTIRKISPGGVVTTLAGAPGQIGSADAPGGAARFNQPCGLALDAKGNLYVADAGNAAIRMISSAGVVTTLGGTRRRVAADKMSEPARFFYPTAVAVGADGSVIVADAGNRTLLVGRVPAHGFFGHRHSEF